MEELKLKQGAIDFMMANQLSKGATFTRVEITDKDYFFMIENQVRDKMPKFEVGIVLPKLERLFEENDISIDSLIDYPIEGYYYKTELLKKYFKLIRNLQENKVLVTKINTNSNDYFFIKQFAENSIFGSVESDKKQIKGNFEGRNIETLFTRRKDPLQACMQSFPQHLTEPWTSDAIMEKLPEFLTGAPNLVELGALVGEKICVCCGAETNVLYRDIAMISGCAIQTRIIEYIWKVSSKVQSFGEKLVDSYNRLLDSRYFEEKPSVITKPDIFNHTSLNKQPDLPRAVWLGEVMMTGKKYHWIFNSRGGFDEVYSDNVITTESVANSSTSNKYI